MEGEGAELACRMTGRMSGCDFLEGLIPSKESEAIEKGKL
jgi:hypothetical protein